MSEEISIVFFDAHAADMINTSAGAIAKYTHSGHRVTLVALNAGEKGGVAQLTADEYFDLKVKAWEKAASILNVSDLRTLSWRDAETPYNEAATNDCVDIIREVRADIVVTHWKGSFHKDHVNTYLNVMDAVFLAGLPGLERPYPAYDVSNIYFTDNFEDWKDYDPDIYVDITDTIDLKIEAIEQFQNAYMTQRTSGFDYKGFYKSLARVRGCLSREFQHAEGYMTAGYKTAKPVRFLHDEC